MVLWNDGSVGVAEQWRLHLSLGLQPIGEVQPEIVSVATLFAPGATKKRTGRPSQWGVATAPAHTPELRTKQQGLNTLSFNKHIFKKDRTANLPLNLAFPSPTKYRTTPILRLSPWLPILGTQEDSQLFHGFYPWLEGYVPKWQHMVKYLSGDTDTCPTILKIPEPR